MAQNLGQTGRHIPLSLLWGDRGSHHPKNGIGHSVGSTEDFYKSWEKCPLTTFVGGALSNSLGLAQPFAFLLTFGSTELKGPGEAGRGAGFLGLIPLKKKLINETFLFPSHCSLIHHGRQGSRTTGPQLQLGKQITHFSQAT